MDYFILFLFAIFVVIITLAILLAVYTKKKDKKKTKILSIALASCSSLLLLLILIYFVLKIYSSRNKTKRYEYANVTVGASSAITPVYQLNSFESPHDTSVSFIDTANNKELFEGVVTPIYQIPSKSSDEKEAFEGVSFIDTAKYPRFKVRDDIPPTEGASRKDANPIQPDNTTEIKSLQTLDQQQVAQPGNEVQKEFRRNRNRARGRSLKYTIDKNDVEEEKVEEEKVGEEKVESVSTVRKREKPKPTKTPNQESIPEQTQESITEQPQESDAWVQYLQRMLTINDVLENRDKTENKKMNRKGKLSSSLHLQLDEEAPSLKGKKRIRFNQSRNLPENNTRGDASVEKTTAERQKDIQ